MRFIYWFLALVGYRSHYLVMYAFSIDSGRVHGTGHIDIDVRGFMTKKNLKEVIQVISEKNSESKGLTGAEYSITNIRRWWL